MPGGLALAETESGFEVYFTVDRDTDFSFDADIDCSGRSCSATVELTGGLANTLLSISTTGGAESGSV